MINEALRAGLEQVEKPASPRPYVPEPHPLGQRPGFDVDNIQELLSQVKREDAR